MPTETSVIRRIHALRQMNVAELQAEWLRLYGEPTRSRNKQFLWRRLAFRTQELDHGGLSAHAKAKIADLGAQDFVRAKIPTSAPTATDAASSSPERTDRPVRDLRLPPVGSVISKNYKGVELQATVRDDGIEFQGRMFSSLTAVAKHVTGCHSINGRLLWNLVARKRKS